MASALLLLLLLSLASAQSFSHQRGLIFNLDNGELCLQSAQCKSSCCHRTDGLSLARCANRAAENQECSPKSIYGVYYKCPCENGLTCEADKSIVGSITNTNYGICQDPGHSSK
ncbi:UDP-GlcNAc:betaGal beta-1,3-N-acetylglucosaminyltransferase 2 [Platysternon megacephalum]|uniref:UDP-GlcNAc:betaGal beta-1,3-N-acetylglucosaminyltransferase 2 n=1 Tax=Platysternon megacephalum TaxID=55544 RepID=A0A4D9E974_9SAUR|nr:UDP-GlcNAc:betaGal beta-1,3-N-acetylglucosaminyltransferase 2 [Platysternon megacephalum]